MVILCEQAAKAEAGDVKMTEILNVEEVARIAARMEPEPGHRPLLDAFIRRYPGLEFNLIGISSFHRDLDALIGPGGETVAEDYKAWVTEEYRSEGGDAKAVYRKHAEARIAISEEHGEHVVITIPYGEQPEAFLQLEFEATRRIAERLILNGWEPDDLDDLLCSSNCLESPQILSPWRYHLKGLTNVRTFLRDLTDMECVRHPKEFPKEIRYFQDWGESSAGLSGARLCAHWWLSLADARRHGGGLSYIPRWADSDCSFPYVSLGGRWSNPSPSSITSPPDFSLPHVRASAHRSIYTLMAALEEFDERAGYPMAWYFYLLHGNRVEQGVGDAVAMAVREGRIGIPEHDARVLARWRKNSYGF